MKWHGQNAKGEVGTATAVYSRDGQRALYRWESGRLTTDAEVWKRDGQWTRDGKHTPGAPKGSGTVVEGWWVVHHPLHGDFLKGAARTISFHKGAETHAKVNFERFDNGTKTTILSDSYRRAPVTNWTETTDGEAHGPPLQTHSQRYEGKTGMATLTTIETTPATTRAPSTLPRDRDVHATAQALIELMGKTGTRARPPAGAK